MVDPVELGKAMGAIVREAVEPLQARISHLEQQLAGRAELSVDDVVRQIDLDAIAKAAAALVPSPQDGQSVTADDVRPMITELVEAAVRALPPAAPGKDADMADLKLHLAELVKQVQLPAAPSVDEVAAAFERRFSDLTLSWERQARDTFERAVDRMPVPKDGQDGRDALPLESFDLSLGEDGRTVTVKMQAGETVIEKSVRIAAVIDQGVYRPGRSYEKGDGATYGGSFWIAQKDSPEGVPGGSADWRLAVKKGRDGKDLRDSASKHDPSKGVPIK